MRSCHIQLSDGHHDEPHGCYGRDDAVNQHKIVFIAPGRIRNGVRVVSVVSVDSVDMWVVT